jgi:hypothetical protein
MALNQIEEEQGIRKKHNHDVFHTTMKRIRIQILIPLLCLDSFSKQPNETNKKKNTIRSRIFN